MTDAELLVIQAKKLEEKNEEVVRLKTKIKDIEKQLISVGAPLNDNVLLYNDRQLRPFCNIRDIING